MLQYQVLESRGTASTVEQKNERYEQRNVMTTVQQTEKEDKIVQLKISTKATEHAKHMNCTNVTKLAL